MQQAYFDNAATTFPKPEPVYQFMDKFYRENGVNVGRGQHRLAAKASALVEETRELLKELFHCANKKVVFTHTATEAINVILRGLSLPNNSNIYITPFEHNAVTRVLTHMQSFQSLNLHELIVESSSYSYDLQKIEEHFFEHKPDVVIMSHASNVCGLIAPIKEICSLAKHYGAITVIDMCQTAGLIDSDLSSDIYDFAVFAGHKTLYGPLGVAGFLCGDIKPTPLLYGGTGIDSANPLLPNEVPVRYEVGSPNIMAISGLNAALRWIRETTVQSIYAQEKRNHELMLQVLNKYHNISIIGQKCSDNTVGVVSCVFGGYSSDEIGRILSERDIAVRTGLHCAPMAHKFLGTYPAGTVRFSVSYFNVNAEFNHLSDILGLISES